MKADEPQTYKPPSLISYAWRLPVCALLAIAIIGVFGLVAVVDVFDQPWKRGER